MDIPIIYRIPRHCHYFIFIQRNNNKILPIQAAPFFFTAPCVSFLSNHSSKTRMTSCVCSSFLIPFMRSQYFAIPHANLFRQLILSLKNVILSPHKTVLGQLKKIFAYYPAKFFKTFALFYRGNHRYKQSTTVATSLIFKFDSAKILFIFFANCIAFQSSFIYIIINLDFARVAAT